MKNKHYACLSLISHVIIYSLFSIRQKAEVSGKNGNISLRYAYRYSCQPIIGKGTPCSFKRFCNIL
jgi:hypothetical protein